MLGGGNQATGGSRGRRERVVRRRRPGIVLVEDGRRWRWEAYSDLVLDAAAASGFAEDGDAILYLVMKEPGYAVCVSLLGRHRKDGCTAAPNREQIFDHRDQRWQRRHYR